jgi:hypothetical protein
MPPGSKKNYCKYLCGVKYRTQGGRVQVMFSKSGEYFKRQFSNGELVIKKKESFKAARQNSSFRVRKPGSQNNEMTFKAKLKNLSENSLRQPQPGISFVFGGLFCFFFRQAKKKGKTLPAKINRHTIGY